MPPDKPLVADWCLCAASAVVNFSNNPIEIVESEYPLMIERYGYVPDSGGPGKFRGGLALVRQYRFLAEEGIPQLRTDRRAHVPYGLQGGRVGTPSMNLLWHDGEMRELPAKCRLTIRRGDVFRHVLGGAGSWGNPAERDRARVAHDVAEDKLSAEYARRPPRVRHGDRSRSRGFAARDQSGGSRT